MKLNLIFLDYFYWTRCLTNIIYGDAQWIESQGFIDIEPLKKYFYLYEWKVHGNWCSFFFKNTCLDAIHYIIMQLYNNIKYVLLILNQIYNKNIFLRANGYDSTIFGALC